MTLSNEQVKHIAKLARLPLAEDELTKYASDLNAILGYVEQLQELDTTGVEPMVAAVKHQKAWREDKIIESDTVAMLANAPDKEDTAIKVPQMS